ncbi:MAG TPA: hypothetical protein VJ760_05640, partial [Nitrospiraceae bacterium]|nr:hypothetical protein [Nitrospiraceae bacterium]
MKTTSMILMGCVGLLVPASLGFAEIGMSSHVREISPMRQDSLKVPSLNDVPRHASSQTPAAETGGGNAQPVAPSPTLEPVSV